MSFTTRPQLVRSALRAAGVAVLGGAAGAQSFADNQTDIPGGNPFNNSRSENVDFGDVDNDGDFDAVFADGGDAGNDQNRIWINQGFLQGGALGQFADETSTRFPAAPDQSRDIEFADIDSDGDLDLYVSNTAQITLQSNRWWVNAGGVQGGTLGFYTDETLARWSGLGGAGSSIAPSQVLGSGGFIDFSCDCDFGDLDNDGDLDLVHSSYGGAFVGAVPTRLFLNDGDGSFSEFNPSLFQLPGQQIANGHPGLWCQGQQLHNTGDSSGAFCDIAATALDIDVGDTDGDLDLDILHGSRQEAPRMFHNRLEQNGGTLTFFRDVSTAVFVVPWFDGARHYEQELGDLDGDGDLDIYGLNWRSQFTFDDVTVCNNGDGTYAPDQVIPLSTEDENEGDFFDWDNDGDIDLFVANFGGDDLLYDNQGGCNSLVRTFGLLPGTGIDETALDADCADVDNDGDTDVFVANDLFFPGDTGRNLYLENLTQIADTHAPKLFRLEQAPDRVASQTPTVVRVQVYDNAPYYVTWYNPTWLEVSVVGGEPAVVPMASSAGQVFRGEIPGLLLGQVCYRAFSADREGNTSQSAELCFQAEAPSFCDAADGSLAACPCGNPGNPQSGCDIAQGTGGVHMAVVAQQTAPQNGATLRGTGFPMVSTPAAIVIRGTALDPASPVVFGDGLRCVGVPLVRLGATVASGGVSTHAIAHGSMAGGGPFFYQLWFRNTPIMFCDPAAAFNTSNGRTLTW